MSRRARAWCLGLALATPLAGLSSGAFGVDVQVTVACPEWAPEAAAQVEARIRASLLLEGRGVQRVNVACDAEAESVEVTAESGQLVRPVARRGRSLEDDVVEAVERALQELRRLAAVEGPEPPVEVAAPVAAAAQPTPPPVTSPPTPAAPSDDLAAPRRERVAEVQARALGERWSGHWAWGGEAGLSLGDARLQLGLVAAGRVATGEPASFDVQEWSVAGRVQVTLREVWGLRGGLGLGASVFVAAPAPGIVAESSTLLGTGFVELSLSRPFWLGAVGLTPALGARLFSASRDVRVNDEGLLTLPRIAPQASLMLLGRIPL